MSIGLWQFIIIIAVVIILFGGKGKVSAFFSEFAKGIKTLRKELSDSNEDKDSSDKSNNNLTNVKKEKDTE